MDAEELERRRRGGRKGAERSPASGEYDIAPFREAWRKSGLSLTEVARRCEWFTPDQDRAGRALGVHFDHGKLRKQLCHKTAVRLMEALDVDPIDVGL